MTGPAASRTNSRIRLTPVYGNLFGPASYLALPLGRKELASAWWMACPNACRAHLPGNKNRPCTVNCLLVRRNVSLLSKKMISAELKIDGACKHPNLVHISKIHRLSSDPGFEVKIGDLAEAPWMHFRIQTVKGAAPAAPAAPAPASRKRARVRVVGNPGDTSDSSGTKRQLFERRTEHSLKSRAKLREHGCWGSGDSDQAWEDEAEDKISHKSASQSDTKVAKQVTPGQRSKFYWSSSDDDSNGSCCRRGLFGQESQESESSVAAAATGKQVTPNTTKKGTANARPKNGELQMMAHRRKLLFQDDSSRATPSQASSLCPPTVTNAALHNEQESAAADATAKPTLSSFLSLSLDKKESPRVAVKESISLPGAAQPSLSFLSMPSAQESSSGESSQTGDEGMCEATQWHSGQSKRKWTSSGCDTDLPVGTEAQRYAFDLTMADWKALREQQQRQTAHTATGTPSPSKLRRAVVDLILLKNAQSSGPVGGTDDRGTAGAIVWLPPLLNNTTTLT